MVTIAVIEGKLSVIIFGALKHLGELAKVRILGPIPGQYARYYQNFQFQQPPIVRVSRIAPRQMLMLWSSEGVDGLPFARHG